MLELEDPSTGHRALVVGTAHVSARAAEEVRRLLEEARPEMCAIELDKHRLKQALLRLRHLEAKGWEEGGEQNYNVPTTAWKVLRIMYGGQGGPARIFYVLSDSFSSSILGAPYGVDMLTAISTCERLGIKLVPIDRPAGITFARVMAQGQQMGALQKRMQREQERALEGIERDPEDIAPKGPKAQRAASMRRMRDLVRRAAEAAGCPDPDRAVAALVTTVHLAMEDKEVAPEDLREVRSCATRVVEFVRQAALAGPSPADKAGDKASSPAGAPGADPKEGFQRAVRALVNGEGPPALTSERDLILAQNLRLCTEKGPTVAVVGAGHVPGIKARWATALDPPSVLEAKEYLTLPRGPYARSAPPTWGGGGAGRATGSAEGSGGSGGGSEKGSSGLGGGEGGAPALEGFRTEDSPGGRALHGYAPCTPGAPQGRRFPLGPVLVGASFVGLSVYRPRAAAVLGLVVGGMAATGNYMIASTVARAGRAAARLEEASKKLAADGGVEGDQFLF